MNAPASGADAGLAEAIAAAAGRILICLTDSGLLSGKALGDEGDTLSDHVIRGLLRAHRPDDGLLSEEGAKNPDRLQKERVWIVDPLDGTREYAEGRTDFAVHIGLAVAGVATVGAVALPALGLIYSSANPPALPQHPANRILVSRTRPPPEAATAAACLGAALLPMGSAGAKVMALLRGEAVAYVHSGGQYEWDSAAPIAIARAAGLHVSRLDGAPLIYNQADPYVPDLLVARPEIADRLMAALATPR